MFWHRKPRSVNRHVDGKRSVSDSVLGELLLSDDDDYWESTVAIDGKPLQFQLSGDPQPSPAVLSHAHDIVRDFADFSRTMSEFLESEAERCGGAAHEIRQLVLESVCLCWPQRPDDGMLYFKGPDEYRLWRCNYINRKPQGLGFDD
ncbi:MAG: hypothetical protein WDN28_19700 [Chthoniobacter sp.]